MKQQLQLVHGLVLQQHPKLVHDLVLQQQPQQQQPQQQHFPSAGPCLSVVSWTGYCASHSCLSMTTVKAAGKLLRQGLLVKVRTTGQSKDYWSKQGIRDRYYCIELLVNGYLSMATFPRHGKLSKARLLVNGHSSRAKILC